jgi:glycosyltransferase involved in cell wall biosynthesis
VVGNNNRGGVLSMRTNPNACDPAMPLLLFREGYEALVSLLDGRRKMRPETVLALVREAASYAMVSHPGRFADGALENVVLDIAAELNETPADVSGPASGRAGRARRVLHVMSTAHEIGGHTRTLLHWIRCDPESLHHLVLTDQTGHRVPEWLVEAVRTGGGWSGELPTEVGPLAAAQALRALARSCADVVVLHHGGHDLVPILGLAAPDLPPVAVLNHADHIYWLGSSVTDVVINQREAGARLSRERRHSRCDVVLPIPLPSGAVVPRNEARRRLGVPADQLVLLSVGRALKYVPNDGHDFLRTARAILDRVPGAHLYVVGLRENEAARFPTFRPHPRLHLCGPVADPSLHRAAADLYLESFPFGSATALLEAAQSGLATVWQYNPPFDLLTTNHGLEALLPRFATEGEYVERVCQLAESANERAELGAALAAHVRTHHTGEGWRQELTTVYAHTDRLTHRPARLPHTPAEARAADVALSDWHQYLKRNEGGGTAPRGARQEVLNMSHRARWRGDHRGAFELLWREMRARGADRPTVSSALKVPVLWAARALGLAVPPPSPAACIARSLATARTPTEAP